MMTDYYLGRPGSMTRLQLPDSVVAAPLSRSEVLHGLASGGSTTTRHLRASRAYAVNASALTPDDAETWMSYYLGGRGPGPFALVDPVYRNHMSTEASTFGAASGANTAWGVRATDDLPVLDPTYEPAIPGSAVLRWPHPQSGHAVAECLAINPNGTLNIDTVHAVPFLEDQDVNFTCYVRTLAGSFPCAFALWGADAGGYGVKSVSRFLSVNSTWRRLTMPLPAGSWSQSDVAYLVGSIGSFSAGIADVLMCNAAIEYGATKASPWVTGLGVPRVSFGPVGSSSKVTWRRDLAFTLTEV